MAEDPLRVAQDRRPNSGLDQSSSEIAPSDAPSPAAELPLATLLVVAALAAAVVGQGGYYRTAQRVVAVLLAAAAVLALRRAESSDAILRPIVAASATLAAWSVVSAALAGDVAPAASTVLILASGVIVVVTCVRLDDEQRDQLAVAVVALGVLVALSGWAGVAWHRAPWALKDQNLWRAATTITYANAAAGFLAVVALLSVARSTRSSSSVLVSSASCLLLTGVGATLSRGGILSFLIGALVLARLLGLSVVARAAAAPTAGALVALAGVWPSIPESAPARPVVAVVALVLGLVVAAGVARLGRRPLLVAAVAVTGALALAVFVWEPARDASRTIAEVRFSAASSDRAQETRAALRVAARQPLTGVGPGRADLSWERADGAVLVARYAHNEYLQVLAELGVIGLGLLFALFAVVARVVRRCRPSDALRPVWGGAVAGLVALGVHGLFDFGWHLPAIALTGALLVGIVTTSEREEQQ